MWIIWLNDWLSWVELRLVALRCVASSWVELRWGEWVRGGGREGQREGESERVWCMGAENDHFVNVRSSLDRGLTTQFDWLEISLTWNCIGYVFADQLSSAIIHHDLIWYDVHVRRMCPFNDNTPREYNHSSSSNVWMLLLIVSYWV